MNYLKSMQNTTTDILWHCLLFTTMPDMQCFFPTVASFSCLTCTVVPYHQFLLAPSCPAAALGAWIRRHLLPLLDLSWLPEGSGWVLEAPTNCEFACMMFLPTLNLILFYFILFLSRDLILVLAFRFRVWLVGVFNIRLALISLLLLLLLVLVVKLKRVQAPDFL